MISRALITGAASGLGWALSQRYLDLGWHVTLMDIDEAQLLVRGAELQAAGRTRFTISGVDLTDDSALSAALQQTGDLDEGLDLLINNAGITHRSPASSTDTAVFDLVMSVNWRAPVQLSRLCLPALEQRRGQIVNISSMAAWMPVPGRAAYGASKAAMKLHFEAWRPELLQRGIRLLMVYPGFVATGIEQNALGGDGQKTNRARSKVGSVQTVDAAADAIVRGQQRGRQSQLAPQWSSRIGAWLWFHFPHLYQRITWRKFAMELTWEEDSQDNR